MDDPRDVTQNCQTDIDEQVSTTSSLQKDTERREEDGQDNFADITRFSRISDLWKFDIGRWMEWPWKLAERGIVTFRGLQKSRPSE